MLNKWLSLTLTGLLLGLILLVSIPVVYSESIQNNDEEEILYQRNLIRLDYEIDYQYSDNLPAGVSVVIKSGRIGAQEEVVKSEFAKDQLVREEVISVKSLMAPENKVILAGNGKVVYFGEDHSLISYEGPVMEGSGNFALPVRGYKLASLFGERNGRFHYGVDLLAPLGTPVYAADGGTVIYAGPRNSYGLLIILDHGNGFKSYYSHESVISVNVGDDVIQGQEIGRVGQSGNATATHLHFEIHRDDKVINPQEYLVF